MATQPQLAVTGYRGIWEQTLTVDIVKRFTKAFTILTTLPCITITFIFIHLSGTFPRQNNPDRS